jgi:hypothetical protein
MKVGDLARCTFKDYGIGIITKKRPSGGFIVRFPIHPERYARKGLGLAERNIEVIA